MKKAEFAKNPKVSYSVEAAKAKLFAAETAMAVTTEVSSYSVDTDISVSTT